MKISTKGRYALRVMVDLAQHEGNEYISLKEISERQEVSMKYLEMIVGILGRSGFVLSLRGKNGGYKLAKTPADYAVGSILKLTEGSLAPVACLDGETNQRPSGEHSIGLPLWHRLDNIINDYLESITLQELIDRKIPEVKLSQG